MLPLKLSQTDLNIIKVRKNAHSCSTVRNRLQVLWMIHHNFTRSDTALATACHPNSVTNIVRMYQEGDLDQILRVPTSTMKHALADRFDEVKKQLKQASVHTLKEGQQWLSDNFGYQACKESVRNLFHRLGFRRLKVNPFPGNPKKLKEWLANQAKWIKHLEKLHAQALRGKLDMAFCDAAHFVYGKFCSYLWSDGPLYKSTGSGRQRLNVYGAYDPVTGRVMTNYGEGNIDAEYIVNYLNWLRENQYMDHDRPLHLMMDNARYQHCQYVKQEAKKLNIKLEFQPSYSPNLNLIERIWKYMKDLVGKCHYQTKDEFFMAVTDILKATNEPVHQDKFATLLTMKFQTYEESQILHG